jgi:hypothetical protein
MLRYAAALLIWPALFLLPAPAPGRAPGPAPALGGQIVNDLAGTYENVSGGGYCYVYGRPRGYLFVNENGSQALFAYAGPGQLRMIRGDWDPSVIVSVEHDPYGRVRLRFDSPNAPTGYWARVG